MLERWERLSKLNREKLAGRRPLPEEFVNIILQRGGHYDYSLRL